jgi:hypothetical protein
MCGMGLHLQLKTWKAKACNLEEGGYPRFHPQKGIQAFALPPK